MLIIIPFFGTSWDCIFFFNSRGGKQNFKAEECVWKRVSKDGKHYRIIQHSTGYFYQKGFLPSDTAEQDEEEEINEDKDDAVEGDGEEEEGEEATEPPAKKGKGGKGRARVLRHLPRYLRQLRTRPRRRPRRHPSAHPSAPASRARDTYPRMYPYVFDMYHECILCASMYLMVKIRCILNVS